MKIKLFDSNLRQKIVFQSLRHNKVRMYVCGPTVYSRPHIGNIRSIVVYDLLYRIIRLLYPSVIYVRNITDVDDKIIAAADEQSCNINDITAVAIKQFHEDCDYVHCLRPDIEPKATENIQPMIEAIELLISKGHAYESQGHILFAIESFEQYGKLSNRNTQESQDGNRIETPHYKKKNPGDFVLWKPESDNKQGWNSPFGFGRPGWHIECSAMSVKYLSDTFDIHGGGVDLKFPHHENEVAQSICAFGGKYAKHWIHNGSLLYNGEKMSKSLGNIVTVEKLRNRNISGTTVKYLLLSAHYRQPLNYTTKLLEDATSFITRIVVALGKFGIENMTYDENLIKEHLDPILDDINTPKFFSQFSGFLFAVETEFNSDLGEEDKIPGYEKFSYQKDIAANKLFSCGVFAGLWTKESLQHDYNSIQKPICRCIVLGETNEEDSRFEVKSWARFDYSDNAIIFMSGTLEKILVYEGSKYISDQYKLNGSMLTLMGTGEVIRASDISEAIVAFSQPNYIEISVLKDELLYYTILIDHTELKQIWYLACERLRYKKDKNFTESDIIRNTLETKYSCKIIDRKDGSINAIRIFTKNLSCC